MRSTRYVPTRAAKDAVRGREADIARAIGIAWNGSGKHIHCPDPAHPDKNPSWRLTPDGRVVCTCRPPHSIFDVIGYVKGLSFEDSKVYAAEIIGRRDLIVEPTASFSKPAAGLTLAEYAKAKRLSIERLKTLQVRDTTYGKGKEKTPAVAFPFHDADGRLAGIHYRLALNGPKNERFRWSKGASPCLYGAHIASLLKGVGYFIIVEGESDTQTLWQHGFPALGLPGAALWNEERDAPLLADVPIIYVVVEPDEGGKATLNWLAKSSIAPRARLVRLPPETKDPSALYLANPDGFKEAFQRALDTAEPFSAAEIDNAETSEPQSELAQTIAEFNRRYAVVNENGKVVVYERTQDPILRRSVIVRIQFADLKKLYQHQMVSETIAKGKTITKSAADWWLSHRDRRTYPDGVVFDPTGKAPATCWNLWNGFAVEPEPGDWGLMREHVHKVLCAGNDAHFQYVIRWAARMFQYPAEPGEVVLVIRGLKGAGKGIFLTALVLAWGAHGIHIRDAKHLVGNFNAHLRDCVCLFSDEAFFAGDRQHEGVLKGLVTERTLPIEGKGQNLITAPNVLHVMMSSNSEWVVPASHDERRYAVFDATADRIGDRPYFRAIAEQMENGGLAAMIHELLHLDLTGFEVRDIPDSKALADQKKHSLDSLDRWWLAVLERGFVWRSRHGLPEFNEWREFVSTELLNRSYLQWCAENRIQRPMTRVQLGIRMTGMYQPCRPGGDEIIGEVEAATPTFTGANTFGYISDELVVRTHRPPGYAVGGLKEARISFTKARGVAGEWAGLS
jgi:Family of unknown function (DUF5906)